MHTARDCNLSNQAPLTRRLDQIWNWYFHWSTDTALVHSTSVLFLTRAAALTPTRLFPAPQGSTMMPLRARPLPNILVSDFSW